MADEEQAPSPISSGGTHGDEFAITAAAENRELDLRELLDFLRMLLALRDKVDLCAAELQEILPLGTPRTQGMLHLQESRRALQESMRVACELLINPPNRYS